MEEQVDIMILDKRLLIEIDRQSYPPLFATISEADIASEMIALIYGLQRSRMEAFFICET
jgi:hypothetical protein